MRKIIAVSGGVDSVVLFDLMRPKDVQPGEVHLRGIQPEEPAKNLVVAHFNHGTRPSADDDQKFVEELAKKCGVRFEVRKMLLGERASEETARTQRYRFFAEMAEKYADEDGAAEVFVAHHLDDLVESVAINCLRGTGWRGLTPMQGSFCVGGKEIKIRRPLLELGWGRREVLQYAAKNGLSFRFDPTNGEDKYLRNRVRAKISEVDADERRRLYHEMNILYEQQKSIRAEVEKNIHDMIYSMQQYPRAWFLVDENETVQLEILKAIVRREGISATRPQLTDFLSAIRNYAPQKKFNLPGGRFASIQKTYFVI